MFVPPVNHQVFAEILALRAAPEAIKERFVEIAHAYLQRMQRYTKAAGLGLPIMLRSLERARTQP